MSFSIYIISLTVSFHILSNLVVLQLLLPPQWYLHPEKGMYYQVWRLACFTDLVSNAGSSAATDRVILGEVLERSDTERYPGTPRMGVVQWASTSLT
jgi:hypothetical protein